MKNLQLKTTLLLIFTLIGAMLLVACGPSTTDPSQENILNEAEVDPVVATGDDNTEPIADGDDDMDTAPTPTTATNPTPTEPPTTAPEVNADPDTAETNADGIPVGFTEEGYPYIGYLDAPVIVEEFSDFQCPFCARFHQQTLPALIQNDVANGDVLFIFRDFPLSIHAQAPAAGNAALCAGDQSAAAYWEMHDLLFETLGQWSGSHANDFFKNLATRIPNLDTAAFATCVDEGTFDQTVQANFNSGRERNVSSTPHFFVNGTSLIGAQPLVAFQQQIALALSGEAPPPTAVPAAAAPGIAPTPVTLKPDHAFAYGDPNAPVKIVEFTDYQCPFCNRHVQEVFPTVLAELIDTGRVYYQIKDLPLESIHPQARLAHIAARCAGDQEAYPAMHDALFTQQGDWGNNPNAEQVFMDMAAGLGLDSDQFNGCLSDRKYDAEVQANLQEAASLGANGTPFFFVDGFPLSGARPIEHFQIAVGMAEEGTLAQAFVQQPEPTPVPAPTGPIDVNTEGGYAIGDPNAPVTIVEFTDYQCPFCQRHHSQTHPLLLENYIETGQVYYVVKDFPLTSIHPQAPLAHEAAYCAGEQDAQTEMGDLLFANMSQWSGNPNHGDVFKQFAANNLGLDSEAFDACLDSRKYQGLVANNQQEGIGYGVTGTPAFFVNGRFLSGAQPFNVFVQYIEASLSETN